MEQFITLFIALIVAAVTYGTPLLFGTLGEILTEKSGNLNLGVEGILFMGGAFGLGGVFYYEKLASSPNGYVAILVGLFFAFLAGAIASLIFSFITITLRANQNVTGLALSIFGTGVGQFMGEFMRVREGGYVAIGNELKAFFIASPFPKFLQDVPYAGKILFSHSFFFYLAIILAVVLYLYLNKSRSGLYLRAVGESPATADAAGINVTGYKYLSTIIGGGISASVHRHGEIIDSVGDDDGQFSPERSGCVPSLGLIKLCYSGKYTYEEMRKKIRGRGGMYAHLGTSDCRVIEQMIRDGDRHADLIFQAQAYQIAKAIGLLSIVLKGDCDAIILTGGVANSKMLTERVEDYVKFIAPVCVMPGENEMEALALGGMRILQGEENARIYHIVNGVNGKEGQG